MRKLKIFESVDRGLTKSDIADIIDILYSLSHNDAYASPIKKANICLERIFNDLEDQDIVSMSDHDRDTVIKGIREAQDMVDYLSTLLSRLKKYEDNI